MTTKALAVEEMSLADVVRDATVVLLGEATHGDGVGMEAMADIVKALHADHGFRVLAFESPAWCVERSWRSFVDGKATPVESAAEGVYSIWTGAAEMLPLWDYLAQHASAPDALRLVGIDCQVSRRGIPLLLDALGEPQSLAAQLPAIARGDVVEGSDTLLDRWAGRARNDELLTRTIAGLRNLRDAALATAVDAGDPHAYCARDVWMGEALLDLVEQSPGQRIVAWAASFHVARGSAVIDDTTGDGLSFSRLTRMGDVVERGLGQRARVIALTAGGGEFGQCHWDHAVEIDPPQPGSFEDACVAANTPLGLLRPPAGSCVARPFGYSPTTARWRDVVDAFCYVPHMRAARPL